MCSMCDKVDVQKNEVGEGEVEGEYVLPYNTWVRGEELDKMMKFLGITSRDLKPLSEVINREEVSLGIEGLAAGHKRKTLREILSERGLDCDQIFTHFSESSEDIRTHD